MRKVWLAIAAFILITFPQAAAGWINVINWIIGVHWSFPHSQLFFTCVALLVCLALIWWDGWKRPTASAPEPAPAPPAAPEPRPDITLISSRIEDATGRQPALNYPIKLRAVLKTGEFEMRLSPIQWIPRHPDGRVQVGGAGYMALYQVERDPGGAEAGRWGPEMPIVTIPPRTTFRLYISLDPAIDAEHATQLSDLRRLGTLVIPATVADVERDVSVQV